MMLTPDKGMTAQEIAARYGMSLASARRIMSAVGWERLPGALQRSKASDIERYLTIHRVVQAPEKRGSLQKYTKRNAEYWRGRSMAESGVRYVRGTDLPQAYQERS